MGAFSVKRVAGDTIVYSGAMLLYSKMFVITLC
jgi:hypothetical protein